MKIEFSRTTILFTLLFMILGYFVYGSLTGALGMGLIYFVMITVMVLSIIPIIGWVIAMGLNHFIVIPEILNLTGLHHTWLINMMEITSCLIGFILTACITLFIISCIIGYIVNK